MTNSTTPTPPVSSSKAFRTKAIVTPHPEGVNHVRVLPDEPQFAVDVETNGRMPWNRGRVICTSIAMQRRYLKKWMYGPNSEGVKLHDNGDPKYIALWQEGEPRGSMAQIIEDASKDKVYHNAKFDRRHLANEGLAVSGRSWDTGVECHLIDGRNSQKHSSLDNLSRKYLPPQYRKVKDVIIDWFTERRIPKARRDFSLLPKDILESRNCGDTIITLALHERVHATVAKNFPFLLKQEHDLIPVVQEMEDRGVLIDQEEVEKQIQMYSDIVDEVDDFCCNMLGWDHFGMSNPHHHRALLKAAGCLDQIKATTKGGQKSTKDWSLRQLHHPAAAMLLVGKACDKMRSTFLVGMRDRLVRGVLHADYSQVGTRTGRFSCSGPNLQNIPIEGDRRTSFTEEEANEAFEMTGITYAPHIKRNFLVRPGYAHIHMDKKQAEMVMLAHYTGSQFMINAFNRGLSIHDEICRLLYGEINKGLKTRTKAVVFGFIYGAGLETLATKIGSDELEARRTRNRLARQLPVLPKWQQQLLGELRERGYVQTIHGRRHYIERGEEYTAVNYMCQGTVGDEIKARMVALNYAFKTLDIDARVLLNIHDDICVEVAEDAVPVVGPIAYRIMHETSMPFALPLPSTFDITYTRWSDLMEITNPLDPTTYTREVHTKWLATKTKH